MSDDWGDGGWGSVADEEEVSDEPENDDGGSTPEVSEEPQADVQSDEDVSEGNESEEVTEPTDAPLSDSESNGSDESQSEVTEEVMEDAVSETQAEPDTSTPEVSDSGGINTAGVSDLQQDLDTEHLAPDAMNVTDAADKGYRWKILAWGPPGLWKTHFAYTMPEPVCIIDTEWKADDLAHKFEDTVVRLWQPDGYDEAVDALHEAINVLDYFEKETGAVGTIVVDSMSIMWEWAQQKHVDEWYPEEESVADVEFKSAMQSGDAGDWKQIKRYHNEGFRDVMLESGYHLYWTAMETEAYGQKIEEGLDSTPMKPSGEKNNAYKVDQVIRARSGDDGGTPVGDLLKSGSVAKHGYLGLEYPTFGKHEDVLADISEVERSDEDVPLHEFTDHDVVITEGVSRYD